jgi:hypothetical protein
MTVAERWIYQNKLSPARFRKQSDAYPYPVKLKNTISLYPFFMLLILMVIPAILYFEWDRRMTSPRYTDLYRGGSSVRQPTRVPREVLLVVNSSPEPTSTPRALPDQRPVTQPNIHVIVVTATPEPLTFPPNWLTVTPVYHVDCTVHICTRIEYNFTPTPTNTVVNFPSMADRDAWFATFTPAPP